MHEDPASRHEPRAADTLDHREIELVGGEREAVDPDQVVADAEAPDVGQPVDDRCVDVADEAHLSARRRDGRPLLRAREVDERRLDLLLGVAEQASLRPALEGPALPRPAGAIADLGPEAVVAGPDAIGHFRHRVIGDAAGHQDRGRFLDAHVAEARQPVDRHPTARVIPPLSGRGEQVGFGAVDERVVFDGRRLAVDRHQAAERIGHLEKIGRRGGSEGRRRLAPHAPVAELPAAPARIALAIKGPHALAERELQILGVDHRLRWAVESDDERLVRSLVVASPEESVSEGVGRPLQRGKGTPEGDVGHISGVHHRIERGPDEILAASGLYHQE